MKVKDWCNNSYIPYLGLIIFCLVNQQENRTHLNVTLECVSSRLSQYEVTVSQISRAKS